MVLPGVATGGIRWAPDLEIVGDLQCPGDIQIDGTIEGLVKGGPIVVGERAKVEGSIVAGTVLISGKANGQVQPLEIVNPGWAAAA